jgi:serine/threonine protein phosphatase PrpC
MSEEKEFQPEVEEEPKEIEVGFVTLTALRHEKSEDAALGEKSDVKAREELVFGVFDGIGGAAGGERASHLAKEKVWQDLREVDPLASAEDWEEAIKQALHFADIEIFKEGIMNFEYWNMGTTAAVAKIIKKPEGGGEFVFGHVGDSRIYILKNEKNLEQITEDDNLLKELSKSGGITKEQARRIDQSTKKEDLKTDNERGLFELRREITQSLGSKKIKPTIGRAKLKRGDRIIITTDGIHDNLTSEQIKNLLSAASSDQEAAEKIADAARLISESHGWRSKDDDMTIFVITLK